jgi:hypothetical protein
MFGSRCRRRRPGATAPPRRDPLEEDQDAIPSAAAPTRCILSWSYLLVPVPFGQRFEIAVFWTKELVHPVVVTGCRYPQLMMTTQPRAMKPKGEQAMPSRQR